MQAFTILLVSPGLVLEVARSLGSRHCKIQKARYNLSILLAISGLKKSCELKATVITAVMLKYMYAIRFFLASGEFRGGKGVQLHPLWQLVMLYITARVHQMIIQQWHAATTTRHSYARISSLLISICLTRPRVALRYSVRTFSYFKQFTS